MTTLTSRQCAKILDLSKTTGNVTKVLFTAKEVLEAIGVMADKIIEAIKARKMRDNLLIVPILNGGTWFANHLIEAITERRPETPIRIQHMRTSRYHGTDQGSDTVQVDLGSLAEKDLSQEEILLCDDVLDGGDSMAAAISALQAKGANIITAVLLDKPAGRNKHGLQQADYTGLTVDPSFIVDEVLIDPETQEPIANPQKPGRPFVFGCGMDLINGYLRNRGDISYLCDQPQFQKILCEKDEEATCSL